MNRRFPLFALTLLLAACSGRPAIRPDSRTLISEDELATVVTTDLFLAVRSLRPHWVREQPARSIQAGEQTWVYLDGQRLGGVGYLRQIAPQSVTSVRYMSGLEASQRWGLGHGQGAIVVSSRR